MTSIITDAFSHDHRRCDHLLALTESGLTRGDWDGVTAAAQDLIGTMEGHFRLEEETLFPRLVEVFRVAVNPIEVMRSEHAQMRMLFEDLGTAVASRDAEGCVGLLETLHFVVQQHNYKEETVLYPMADGALRDRGAEIAALLPGA